MKKPETTIRVPSSWKDYDWKKTFSINLDAAEEEEE